MQNGILLRLGNPARKSGIAFFLCHAAKNIDLRRKFAVKNVFLHRISK